MKVWIGKEGREKEGILRERGETCDNIWSESKSTDVGVVKITRCGGGVDFT